MTSKIFKSVIFACIAVLIATIIIIMGCLYSYFGSVQEGQMEDGLALAAAAVEDGGREYLENFSSDDRYRLTWIAPDGDVLYDTKADAEALENHDDREEVKEALENGEGRSTRYSATFMEKTMYYARRLDDGSVLRISTSRATVGLLAVGMIQPVLIVLVIAIVLSGLFASRLSKWIVKPLNQLDLEHPLENDTYEELSPLLNRLNRQRGQIEDQIRDLKKSADEFEHITSSMKEGLVILDGEGDILSINPSARNIFETDENCIGKDFLTVDRAVAMSAAVKDAWDTGHSELRAEHSGRIYQFDISRIDFEGEELGIVIIAFDITEQEKAEQNRREFTANVSHELKTPLQGIIGSAELIENGMVKQEDMPRFIGHIRAEAQRLVSLIGDIIWLSQLDEGQEMKREDVDLHSVALETAENLHDSAEKRGVKITVDGEKTVVNGVRNLMYEIIYNLCDNAVKYNVDGGKINIRTYSDADGSAVVSVADTGIGIEPEQQGRVFERFYRVDKSHSKASGGTGLGLSIVKHAVQYHGGKISLESEPGKWTTIRVIFPERNDKQQ